MYFDKLRKATVVSCFGNVTTAFHASIIKVLPLPVELHLLPDEILSCPMS